MSTPTHLFGIGALALALGAACVPVQPMTVQGARTVEGQGVSAQISDVAASGAFLGQYGGKASIVAATLSITNRSDGTAVLDLSRATLAVTDPGGEKAPRTLALTSGGTGPAPEAVRLERPPSTITLRPGETARVWLAFDAREPFEDPDLSRAMAVLLPVGEGFLSVPLADPATARPRWVLPPVKDAGYAGLGVITSFDETSIGVLRSSGKHVAGPVVLGPSFSLGVRGGKLRGERERTIVCCDLGLSFDVSLPWRAGRRSSVGPWLSYQAIFALESGRVDKATWHGPAVGLQFFTVLIEPNVARALPVERTPSLLGYSSFTIAYAHMFRRGDDGGSPSMVLLFEHTLPEL